MDNRYFPHGCPALMSDGRLVTNYVDNDVFNQYIAKANKKTTSNQYRAFLQKNATSIMNRERVHLSKKNTCDLSNKALCTYCCTPAQ